MTPDDIRKLAAWFKYDASLIVRDKATAETLDALADVYEKVSGYRVDDMPGMQDALARVQALKP